jgi:hypothetical protein
MLTLVIADNQWLHELQYMRIELLERVCKCCPEAQVASMRMRVGPIPLPLFVGETPEPPPPPTLPEQPDRDTIAALRAIDDPALRQAMANARLALSGRLRRP